MKYELRIRKDAEEDAFRVYDWYEDQSVGLGVRLLSELDDVYERIIDNPLLYANIHRGVRRAVPHNFPVGVFYTVVGNIIQVIAVDHLARSPKRWKGRA